jgi:alpha-L-fucosidase
VKAAKLFSDQSALKFIENEYGITIKVPKNKFDEVDTVIELELK